MLRAQIVQLSLLVSNAQDARAGAVFESAFDGEPDFTQSNKLPNPENPFFSVAGRQTAELQETVQVQPGRVDIFVAPVSPPNMSDIPLIEPMEHFERLLGRLPAIDITRLHVMRVAAFTQLVLVRDTAADATSALLDQVGVDLGVADAADFSLQINRRREFPSSPARGMNRLIRLNEMAFQQMQFQAGFNGIIGGPVQTSHYAAGIQLDFNSAMEDGSVGSELVVSLFEDMISEIGTFISQPRILDRLRA